MSYFKLSQTSGQSGTSTLSVTAEANTGRLSRSGLVTVTAGSVSRTVSLTQKGAGLTAALDENSLSFSSTDEGTVVLEGTTNAQKIVVGASGALIDSGISGGDLGGDLGDGDITVGADAASSDSVAAAASVEVESDGTQNTSVVSNGMPLWSVADNEYTAVVDGVEKTLTLGEDGGDALGAAAAYRFKITFKAQANTDSSSRSGVFGITFSGKDDNGLEGSITRDVTVVQPGFEGLEVSPNELDYEAEGGDKDVTVTSAEEWTASIS
jgi:hypothetical protein